jgi:hypothetical protein
MNHDHTGDERMCTCVECSGYQPEEPQGLDFTASETSRGFSKIKFHDVNGDACSIQASSSAMIEAIWLGIEDANPQILASKARALGVQTAETTGWVPYPIPDDVLMTTRMHLTRDQVKSLLPVLQAFVESGELKVPV